MPAVLGEERPAAQTRSASTHSVGTCDAQVLRPHRFYPFQTVPSHPRSLPAAADHPWRSLEHRVPAKPWLLASHACLCMLAPAGYLRLWDASNDPWGDTTDSGTQLDELTSYWNTNMRAQKRTVVYMARRVYCLALGLGRRGGGRSWLPSY